MFSPPSSEISQHIWQKFGSYLGQPEATFIVRGKKKKKEKKKVNSMPTPYFSVLIYKGLSYHECL